MIQKKCEVAIFYNIHNRENHWESLKTILALLKGNGYKKLAMEMPYLKNDRLKLLEDIAEEIKLYPDTKSEMIEVIKESFAKGTETDIKKINGIKNFNSPSFLWLLKFVNAHSTSMQDQYVQIDDIKINFPLTLEQMDKLDDQQKERFLGLVKKAAITLVKRPDSDLLSGLLIIEALLADLKIFGADVASNKECKQSEIKCRDEFMASKVKELCLANKDKIIFSVGLSHYNIGNILSKEKSLTVKQFYLTEFFETNNQDHKDAIDGKITDLNVINISDNNWINEFSSFIGQSEF